MKNYRTKLSQRVRYALLAGMAGAFLIPQVAFAAPTGENVVSGGATVTRSGNDTNINSSNVNNVIKWSDYSLVHGERVVHDGGAKTNNYLNIVTGANTSNIDGKIEGGKNVYIVNPNGVIFGKNAEVNVGHLHVSTQDTSTVNTAANMANNVSPLSTTAAGISDVVNMGKITADTVEVYGKNIRFLNAADVKKDSTTPSAVVLHTDTANGGYAHIGYKSGHVPAVTAYQVNGAAATAADNYYQLVSTKEDLAAINTTNLAGNYMLENDIDLGGAAHTPIGGNSYGEFKGKFDGNFYRVSNFIVPDNSSWSYNGFFGVAKGARIENLGISHASIVLPNGTSNYIGGLAGYTTGGTVLKNVYVTNTRVEGTEAQTGGIVGQTENTTISGAYSKATTNGGGVIGYAKGSGTTRASTVINDTYSDIDLIPGSTGTYLVYMIQSPSSISKGIEINNSYAYGEISNTGTTSPPVNNTYILDKTTGKATLFGTSTRGDMTSVDSYSGWGSAINNTGAPGATWRIYEGRTTPMLTAFMSGTATATYNYRYFKPDGTPKDDTGNTVKSNDGKDITAAYNSYYMKVVDGSTANPTAAGTKANVSFGAGVDTSRVIDYVNSSTKDYDRTNGIRNAGTKAMLWSDQDGPNLSGVNVTITQRKVGLDSGNINPKRMYNGKSDVTKAFRDALTSGRITSSGFTEEDIAAGSVQLDFNKPGKIFKARMVDGSGNATRNVGTHDVKFSGEIGFSGADAGNYEFDGSSLSNLTGKATITKVPLYLTIQKKTADDKIYDGTSVVKDSAMFQTSGSENIKLDKTKTGLTLAQINAGTPTMPDGAIMTGDDDTTRDDVALTNVGGPKYTNEAGVEQLHAGPHKLQYTNVGLTGNDAGNYELYYTPASGTKTAVTGGNVYLDGKIIPRQILRDDFNVYDKTTHAKVDAKKVYDGNDEYTPTSDVYLSSNAVTGGTTGLVERDRNHITFALTGGKGRFAQSDGTTYSKNVRDVEKLAYEVTGHTDDATNYHLSDYYIMDGTTKKDLGSTFRATGAGKITPKALTATVVNQHITKVYDAMDDQTDGKRHIIKGDDLVTLSGWVAGDTARTNTSTAKYADKNVAVDGLGNPTTQSVTYTASFDAGTGVEADNYTLGTQGALPIATTKTLTGGYTGTITPRGVTVKFANATKIYDGMAANTQITASDLDDGLNKDVLNADGLGIGDLSTAGVTSRFGDNKTTATFRENVNAGSRSVEYTGLSNSLGTNYTLANTQYGDGTITRRRIDKSGFRVYNADGSVADATKVYDGNDRYTLASGAYLTGTPASGDTGVVSRDYGKVTFALKTGSTGHFASDADGNNRTSHVSEAHHVAYDVVARTSNATNNPLTNYTFGSAAEETAGTLRNLETVNDTNPAHVTAAGSITPASIRATTKEISKVYDGMREHTDGNRTEVKGNTVVSFTGWVSGQTRDNTSTALYATKDVARDSSGNVIKKSVTYTAQLTGQYADDYQIVNQSNAVISTPPTGSGAAKTVTANLGTVANAGTITPRKLNVTMRDVSKTYDGTAGNNSATVTGFTDDPASSVLADVLGVDNVTASRLTTKYQGMMSASPATATSTYGRGTTSFTANANASNGTQHDVQYTNMRTAFNNEFGVNAGNYTVDETVYGKGTINRRDISPNNFQVRDANGNIANATKVYDGTSSYTLKTGDHLTPNSGPSTGIIATDQNDVFFRLSGDGAQFADSSNNPTANVATARKVLYNVEATGDATKIRNYTLNGVALENGTGKVSGNGSITRRTLSLNLVQNSGIDKVYDGATTLKDGAKKWNALTDNDSTGNVQYAAGATAANKLVTTDGTSFNITSNYRNDANTAPDKNVRRDGSNNPIDKDILYNITLNGDATNYSFDKNGIVTDAESGLTLSATGKITPKDLSGALKKMTKVYDGTKNVPASQVGLESGLNGVVSGDTVTLGSHTELFQSENVNGDGTTETIGGTAQKNWVNYSGLTLGGADAGNYTLASTAKGLGEITPYQLNDNSITFTKRQAEKVYDGTRDVKWTDGSSTTTDQKKYITSATVTVGTAPPVDILDDLKLEEAQYDTKDVVGGTQPRVTYRLSYTDRSGKGNFSLGAGVTSFTTKGDGIITKKDVTATVKSPLTKTYDATRDVVGVAKNNANQVVANASNNITLDGLVANDGTTYTTTAAYADKNAGDNKRIDYTLNFTANGGNYNLKYNGADNAGAFSTDNNTITKRKVDVQFKNPPARTYNGSAENTAINPFVSSADAAVLRKDKQTLVNGTDVQNLAGIASKYVQNDRVTEDPNAGKDKLVRFDNVSAAMNNALGADASNYEFNETAYAKGTINKANIDTSKITFRTSGATKTYDGTDRVKYNGSSASDAVKNYITEATADLGGGHTADLRGDLVIDEKGTKYKSSNAGTGIRVTYKFRLTNSNIEISGTNEFEMHDTGEIKRRVLNLDLAQKSGIDKIYDTTKTVHDTDERHYNAFADHDAKGNVTYAAGTTEDTKLVRKAGNPETTVKVTAEYADENAGTKNVNYTAQIEGDAGKNYTLKYGATEGNAETKINFAATGTIAKRKLTLGFDKASKQYDTEADNPDQKKLMSAIADNSDARGVDTLKRDRILAADGTVNTGAFNTNNVVSEYGTRSNDPANPFTPDPNVGQKDVRYTNVKSALSGAKAGNYDIEDTVYGTGEITRAKIKAADFDFQIDPSKKTYDGTTTVYWKDKEGQWQEAKGEEGLNGAKKYYFGDRSTVKLANGRRVKVNPADFSLTEAAYQNKNVAGGTETWTDANGNTHRNWVNYKLHINTTNFDVEGERDTTRKGVGTITKRDLATMLPKHLIKEYDGQQTFDETNRDYVDALANENITHIVKADQGKIQLKVKGEYDDPNASAETKGDAKKGIHLPAAPNGRKVKYTLTLSGDAATLANYTIAGHDTTHTVTGKAADIYKKTLTVDVARKEKDYDGTAAVNNLAAGDITFSGLVGSETLSLDSGALNKVQGQYLDSNGNADANVSRDVHRNVLDKAVKYTGFDNALSDLATRNNTAKNYRVADGGKSYTVNDAKGRINPLSINPNHPTDGVTTTFDAAGATKIYDRTRAVKYNGQSTSEALKNYLTDATVMVGGKARSIRDEIEIDPTKTHYDDKNAGTGKTVTYGFKYKGDNFEIADFTRESDVKGEIKRKDVKVLPVDQLWKTYDSERDVYVEGDDSIFTRRGGKQGKRVTTGDSVLELEPNGIISGDVVQNDSWAEFTDENAGTGKKVKYHTSFSGTDAANYRFVDVFGGKITKPLETNNNTIAKRKLNIVFDGLPYVKKAYDTDTKNDQITARITDDPNGHTRTVLQRDGMGVFGDRLAQLNNGNIQSDYGYGSTDATFRADANADKHKDVQYRGVGNALRNLLGGYADNYEPIPDNAYSDGAIRQADVSRNEFDPNFTHAHKEYDGTSDVQNLDERYDEARSFWNAHKLDQSNIESLTGSYRGTSSKRGKDVGTNKIVDYTLKLSNRNFNFVGWDGVIQKEGTGDITPRELTADYLPKQTKVYDGTKNIASVGDSLVTFRHKSGANAFINGDKVRNSSTATYGDANVAWQDNAWKNGDGTVADKDVDYDLRLSGTDAANYKIVDEKGNEIASTTRKTGRITPKEIHLKADPQTRWINEGLPDSYTGTPTGKDYATGVNGEALPGEIYYNSPDGRLRWGDYAINGYYRPSDKAQYQRPDGTRYQLADGTYDGDSVARNYRFVQDPANATALHIGPYVPDTDYYQALTQTSKMLPDEYAYENASLDRRSHFGRDPEAEISYEPPSLNMVKDGVDISKNGIEITDETVFRLVNEVFGA